MNPKSWFTSDTHFGHANIIKYTGRPFDSVEEMDEILINNWNQLVKPEDTVYHLGDFSFSNDYDKYRKRLNGNIVFIMGNHDNRQMAIQTFGRVYDTLRAKVNGRYIFLSHFSHRVWDKSHHNAWHLWGHSHGRLPAFGKSFDVGIDANFYCPISYEQVEAIMATCADNWDVGIKDGGKSNA